MADFEKLAEMVYESSADPDLWTSLLDEGSRAAGAIGAPFAVLPESDFLGDSQHLPSVHSDAEHLMTNCANRFHRDASTAIYLPAHEMNVLHVEPKAGIYFIGPTGQILPDTYM